MTQKIRMIVGWALLILLVIFVVLNSRRVYIDFLIGGADMPLAIALILSAAMGAGSVFALRFLKSGRKEK
jgi:uncharacterized integral membrane protein